MPRIAQPISPECLAAWNALREWGLAHYPHGEGRRLFEHDMDYHRRAMEWVAVGSLWPARTYSQTLELVTTQPPSAWELTDPESGDVVAQIKELQDRHQIPLRVAALLRMISRANSLAGITTP